MTKSKSTKLNLPTSRYLQRLVSIDPGVNKIGLATFESDKLVDYTVKVIPIISTVRARLQIVDKELSQYFQEKQPHIIALEKTALSTTERNGLMVLAYYKMLAIARRRHIPVHEYMPLTIRKTVCGNGHATKQEVMKVLIKQYPELRLFSGANRKWKVRHFYNLFDAVAVGVTHIKKSHRYGKKG